MRWTSPAVVVMSLFATVGGLVTPSVAAESPAALDPRTEEGLTLWLDASDVSTLYADVEMKTPAAVVGDPIGLWADKSGQEQHATQTNNDFKPGLAVDDKLGLSYARFVRERDGLEAIGLRPLAGTLDWTVFLVVRVPHQNINTGDVLQIKYRQFARGFEIKTKCKSLGWCVRWNMGAIRNDIKTGRSTSEEWEIWEAVGNEEEVTILIDGEIVGQAKGDRLTVTGGGKGAVGEEPLLKTKRSGKLKGSEPTRPPQDSPGITDLGEILFFESTKTAAQRKQVRDYLSAKWRIPVVP